MIHDIAQSFSPQSYGSHAVIVGPNQMIPEQCVHTEGYSKCSSAGVDTYSTSSEYFWLVVTGTMEFYDFPYIAIISSSQLTFTP